MRLRMLFVVFAAAFGVLALTAGSTTAAPSAVTATNLSPSGGIARAISNAGMVVGDADFPGGTGPENDTAFAWTESGGLVNIGVFSGNTDGEDSRALAVNDAGQVVGYSSTEPRATPSQARPQHAFSWTQAGGLVDLGTLGGEDSEAVDVNESGVVVGWANTATSRQAFLWSDGGPMVDLGAELGWSYSEARAINDIGQVIGIGSGGGFLWSQADGKVELGADAVPVALSANGHVVGFRLGGVPFLWTEAGGFVDVVGPAGALESTANDVSPSGQVVGSSSFAGGINHAFVWTAADGAEDLGTLAGDSSAALAISANGHVVGLSSVSPTVIEYHAFLWTEENGMTDLGALPGGTTSQASVVNDNGQAAGLSTGSFSFSARGTAIHPEPNSGGLYPTLWELGPSGPADSDGDGVEDSIDAGDGVFNDGTTSGSIVDDAGHTITVVPDPDGVRITVTGTGTAKASFLVCSGFSLKLAPNNEVVVACGSVTVEVISGEATVELNASTVVSVPAGVTAKITDNGGGGFAIENLGGGPITVTRNGTASTVNPGQTATVDTSPPVITANVAGTLGNNGWYRSNVSVTWTVVDGQSAVTSKTNCGPFSVTSNTSPAGVQRTCQATSAGGTASRQVVVKRDNTQPNVSWANHASSYTVDQTVSINCSASDAHSGIDVGCQPINAPAYTFALGQNTRSTSATDKAGNTRSVSTSFTVRVTSASLCNLTRQFVRGSAKYQTATSSQRSAVELAVTAACAALNARQTNVYKAAVTLLANNGWLTNSPPTTSQAATLRSLADRI